MSDQVIVRCPEYASGMCMRHGCDGVLVRPYWTGNDAQGCDLYAASCPHGPELFRNLTAESQSSVIPVASTADMSTPVIVAGFTSEGEKALREAMKDKGGASTKTERDGAYLTQKMVADMFGPPCDEDMVSNWERWLRTDGKQGTRPPSAVIDNINVAYEAKLRKNYTGENCKILAAIIENFKSLQAVKTRLGTEKIVHARNDETLYRMQHPDGKVR